ncbi:hypothetical protein C8F04DRAFT_223923 [Mycena alexandri]|uniref:F-box domain-containing protein n=1 Tax=Mycena alexandri TaxID=1745969 RepID=A0AAD6T744_9AGAR|nr:hypothetical protein C8F04DRAFT_223923 [Mycena alexandri]
MTHHRETTEAHGCGPCGHGKFEIGSRNQYIEILAHLLPVMEANVGNIAELRHLVFSFAGRRDLVACAQVCSTWSEDALDIIWRDLPSPTPLLGLVNESHLCPTMTWRQGVGHATISNPLPWERFRTFMVRVRTMCFPLTPSKNLLQRLAMIVGLCPDLPFLPNLSKVTVYPSSNIIWVPIVAMFLHCGVRHLIIVPPEGDGPSFFTYPDFFRELLRRAPLLESLQIQSCSLLTFHRMWRPEDAGILADYAAQFSRLIRLVAPAVVVANLKHIHTALPRLRVIKEINASYPKLHINVARDDWPVQVANLECLAVTVTFACARTLLTENSMLRLQVLYLEAHIRAHEESPTQFFQVLANRCPALAELTVRWVQSTMIFNPQSMENVEIHVSVFEPLQACTSLAILDLSAPFALAFGEPEAERLATLLSHLRICRLAFIPLYGPIAKRHTLPGLAGLVPFATHCHRLEELSINLDPKVPSLGVVPAVRFGPALRKLSIGHFIEPQGWNAAAVARYFAALVPRYCSVTIPPPPHWSRLWKRSVEIEEGEGRLKEAFQLISGV